MAKEIHSLTDSLHKISELKGYNEWLYKNIKKHISGNILEIGCGIGNITDFLAQNGKKITASDIDPVYVRHSGKKYKKNRNIDVVCMDILKPGKKLKAEFYDTAVMLNVLEHIEDEKKVLNNVYKALKPGGKFIVLVPALQAIYGEMDRALGHHKRYSKKDLAVLFSGNNFKVKESFYLNFPGIFGWFFSGRILKKKYIPLDQARIFDKYVLPVVKLTESVFKPVAGQSLIVVAEKQLK